MREQRREGPGSGCVCALVWWGKWRGEELHRRAAEERDPSSRINTNTGGPVCAGGPTGKAELRDTEPLRNVVWPLIIQL